jgi:hypothetical protein
MFNEAFASGRRETTSTSIRRPAPEDRRGQCLRLRQRQQRRVPLRLRHRSGGVRARFERLFSALDRLEADLGQSPWLAGEQPTEADWRLFTTLARFDAVYVGHFKCNRNRIEDFPNLSRFLRTLYRVPGIAATVNMDHIKRHYYMSHAHINPTRIVPVGPRLKFMEDAAAAETSQLGA